jgi:2-desacetyl-2-hydroxyethyl bacteriochlorophyllide A dehydrogenase
MKRKTIYFTAPRQVEICEDSLPALGADDVLVETVCSAISAGTEMMIYQGRFPRDIATDSVISALRGDFKYPLAYGYACVGKIVEVGKSVNRDLKDQLVFSFQPHTTHFITKLDSFFPIPNLLSPESACFLPNMETAVNLVQDAAPILGEKVLVIGQGIVGLLVSSLLKEFPLEYLVTSDCYELRRKTSLEIGVHTSFNPEDKSQTGYAPDFDLTFELSGSPSALNNAIALTRFSGRIIVGSWYGDKNAEIDLGSTFHRSRIKMISSQVSSIAPELSGRWDKMRRFEVAWDALKRIQPQKWITHRFPIEQAVDAYHLLDEHSEQVLQVIFNYGG